MSWLEILIKKLGQQDGYPVKPGKYLEKLLRKFLKPEGLKSEMVK